MSDRLPPGVADAAVAAAIALVAPTGGSGRRVLGCKHFVRSGAPGAYACACHPGAGLFCLTCHTKHAHRHPVEDVERLCDSCGRVVPLEEGPVIFTLNPVIAAGWWQERGVVLPRVGDTGGFSREWPQVVAMACLGVCGTCNDEEMRRAS